MRSARRTLSLRLALAAACAASFSVSARAQDRSAAEECLDMIELAEVPDPFALDHGPANPEYDARRAIDVCSKAVAQDADHFIQFTFLSQAYALAGEGEVALRLLAHQLAWLQGEGTVVFKNHPDLVRRLTALAQAEPEAQVALAHLHLEGVGVPADKDRAISLFRQAAEVSEPEGQFQYGNHLLEQVLAKPDDPQAAAWRQTSERLLRAAAEQCHPRAAYVLGISFDEVGEGEATIRFLTQMGRRGSYRAQFELAQHYYFGRDTARSAVDGYAWLVMATENAHRDPAGLQDLLQRWRGRLTANELERAQILIEQIKASMCVRTHVVAVE